MRNRIKELREQRRMKQRELAELLGVSQNTLSTWETGRYEPDAEMLRKIAAQLNVSVDYLLGGDPPWRDLRGDQIDILRMTRLMRTVEQLTTTQFDQVINYCQGLMIGVGDVLPIAGISADEANLLDAFNRAPDNIKNGILTTLGPYMQNAEKKRA